METIRPLMTKECEIINENNFLKNTFLFKNYPRCSCIGSRNKNRYIYKYMDIETAILCLQNKSIRFVEPTVWLDEYESRFYTADYSLITRHSKYIPKLFACCFTLSKTSEAARKTYSYDKVGLASHCVQFRINKAKFRKLLDLYARDNNCKIYEGPMDYSHTDYIINTLHLTSNKKHSLIFNSHFNLDNYLSLLLLKRQAFYYENEYRFFIIPQKNRKKKAKDIIYPYIEWPMVVEEIHIDHQCSKIEMDILHYYCKKYGLLVAPKEFNLYKSPDTQIKIEP